MVKYLVSFLLFVSISLGVTACGQNSIRQANELAAKLKIYGKNIDRATNDGFAANDISLTVHHAVNESVKRYLSGVKTYEAGIAAAKSAIDSGADKKGTLAILESVFNSNVVNAFVALADTITTVTPELQAKIQEYVDAIRLAIAAFRALVLQAYVQLGETQKYAG